MHRKILPVQRRGSGSSRGIDSRVNLRVPSRDISAKEKRVEEKAAGYPAKRSNRIRVFCYFFFVSRHFKAPSWLGRLPDRDPRLDRQHVPVHYTTEKRMDSSL